MLWNAGQVAETWICQALKANNLIKLLKKKKKKSKWTIWFSKLQKHALAKISKWEKKLASKKN